ncbi:MAG TPA: hypothetical protein VFV58_13080 [Blastocatellia bacterium]|nr:hypothetical protein [Blastocatellia bacterium]
MDPSVLITLLFAIALITLVGHGIWLLLAAIYRALTGEPESQSSSTKESSATQTRPGALCAECGSALQIYDSFCPLCGLARSSAGPMADLTKTARQLDRFLNQGRLDAETHKLVMGLVEEERARLTPQLRRDTITTRREAEPQAPQQAPIESATQQAPPALVEPNVFAVEKNVERVGLDLEEIAAASPAASKDVPMVIAETPRQPRRSFTEMLETFMEESSIRWGELVGGLLIIGCSIALVVSLWSQIVARPFLEFSVFVGVTAALFGLGFYSAHRWKLPTTSRGVLVISTLLAPLNFLAMTAFSRDSAPTALPPSWQVAGGELFSLALFFYLVYQAAKVFLPEAPWMIALATMGPSFAMLLAEHSSVAERRSLRVALLGVAPLICYCASCGRVLRDQARRPKQDESDERRADQIFTHLGIASFAAILPLGLLFIKPGYISQTLRQFAPLVSIFGIPAIATGVALLRWPEESKSGRTLTVATSVSLIGSLISLTALIFAWPYSIAVVITALINCAVSLAIALASSGQSLRYDLRLAHAGAIAHLALAVLIMANLFTGNVLRWGEDGPRLAASLVSLTSGYALALLFALFAAASEGWLKIERKIESRIYGISAVVAGAVCLLLITWHGFKLPGDPYQAAPVYAFYAAAAFVIAWRRENVIASWIGSALLSLTILQSLAFKFGDALAESHPVRLSFLVFANVATVAAVVVTVQSERARKLFAVPFTLSALIASVGVAPFLIFDGWMTNAQISARMLWLAAIWLAIAWLKRSPVLFAAFQLALASSVAFEIADLFGHQWPQSFVSDLKTIQAQVVALTMLSLVWIAVRLALRRFGVDAGAESRKEEGESPSRIFDPGAASKLLYPGWLGVDRVITLLSLAFLVGLSLYGVHVGMVEGLRFGWGFSNESRNIAATALGAGSWSLLLALTLVFIAGLWEQFEKRAALAMLILLACACLLIGGRWGDEVLTPAVYRWSSAIAFAAVSSLIVARNRVTPWLNRFGWPRMEERSNGLSATLRTLSLALFVAPVLVFSSLAFFNGIVFSDAVEFWPGRSWVIAGLIAPLLIVGLSFVAHSIRERSAAYACAAGLMVNLSVTFGYLLWASTRVFGIERSDAYMVAQLNIVATSICSLAWLRFHRRQTALDAAWPRSEAFLKTQVSLALFLSLSALAVADVRLFIDPLIRSALADSFGGVTGILAVALPTLAYARLHDIKLSRLRAEHLGVGLVALGSLLSCLVGRLGADGWIAFHALALALNAAAWLMLALRRPARVLAPVAQVADQRALENWTTALALVIVAMILRGVSSPGEPWWTMGFSISICLLFAGLSLVSGKRGYIYIAALTLNYAATRVYFWLDLKPSNLFSSDYIDWIGPVSLNAIVLALPAIAWLTIDLKMPRQDGARRITPFHRVAARTSLGLLCLTLLFQWLSSNSWSISQLVGDALLDWFALASVVALFVACLWDERSAYALRGLHIIGLIAAAMVLRYFNPGFEVLLVSLVAILSLYALATSALFRGRESLARLAARLRVPLSEDELTRFYPWLKAINVLLGLAAYAITFIIVWNFESLSQRLTAASISVAIPISMALLVSALLNQGLITGKGAESQDQGLITGEGDQNENERPGATSRQGSDNGIRPDITPSSAIGMIGLTTWTSLLSAVLWGWAWLSPIEEFQAINHLAVVMVAAGAILIGYRFIISRNLTEENEWRRGVKAQLRIISAIGLMALVATLSAEALNFSSHKEPPAPWWVVIAIFAALVSLFFACIAFALSPERDPFNLSERGRMNYVYGAEVLTIVTIVHARLTLPWLFGGFFLTWWPLVVMLLAFTGVGLGELFRRRGTLVLAEPLERTGILLPILPVFGYFVVNSAVSYSNLLFLVGLFYAVLSVMRRSFLFGILAVLAGNGGLWTVLDGVQGYGFYQHPQLWLIPVSLSVLVAGHINRDRLTKDQMTMIRYATLMMIYVSSTSDIFINGVSESPWLTIILLVLSVIGVLAGLALRIRAFLFLGTAFLMLSLLAIIYTASVYLKGNWLWYVTGMIFGAMLIIIFALLEKKRREMLALVERLKQWQA